MSKKTKLYHLHSNLSIELQRIMILLNQITKNDENSVETNVLAEIAYETTGTASKLTGKIGRILKI